MKRLPIKKFGPVTSLRETTHTGERLTAARNLILRPTGGFRPTLYYYRLLGIPTFNTLAASLGINTATQRTSAVMITSQAKSWLYFYNFNTAKCRGGPFYLGDSGAFTGSYDFDTGTASYTVLENATLNPAARWYDRRIFEEVFVQNGVDDDRIAQLARAGVLRKAGTNAVPTKAVIVPVAVSTVANVQASRIITGRAGGVNLVFTANATQFPGTRGHNIQIGIIHDLYGSSLYIERNGAGTQASPYQFLIHTSPGPGLTSNDAIIAIWNASTLTFGVATASGADSNDDNNSYSIAAMSGGVDANESVGFNNSEKSVYLRYWDVGTNGFGYEGPSSEKSAVVLISDAEFKDLQVQITGNTAAEGGRFGFIRIYLQFGTGDEAIWNLVRTVPNVDSPNTYTLGTDVEIGQAMSVDQSRPLPSKYAAWVDGKVWKAGIDNYDARVEFSKAATVDELAPEGMWNQDYISIAGSPEETGKATITALTGDDRVLSAHTQAGITNVTVGDLTRFNLPVVAGALNQSMIARWEKATQFYLGADLQIYQLNNARYSKKDAAFLGLESAAYMRDIIDRNRIVNEPERTFMLSDVNQQMMWMWLPATDGTLRGFGYDMIEEGIVGPFDYPKVYYAGRMESNRSEVIFSDEAGNLFYFDTVRQNDRGDDLGDTTPPTAYATGYTPGAAENGYGTVIFGSAKYLRSAETILETGMLDLGSPGTRKTFMGLEWRSVAGSQAQVEVKFTGAGGNSVTRVYGSIGTGGIRNVHRVGIKLQDTAVKVRMRVVGGDQKPWIIRDVTLLYDESSKV